MANGPTLKFSNGKVSASVWENTRQVNGEDTNIKSVSMTKSYRDKNGDWKTTNSLNINEIPQAISVLQAAYRRLAVVELDV